MLCWVEDGPVFGVRAVRAAPIAIEEPEIGREAAPTSLQVGFVRLDIGRVGPGEPPADIIHNMVLMQLNE